MDIDFSWTKLACENSPFIIGYVGADRQHKFVNKAYARWFLREPSEFIGKTLREVAQTDKNYELVEKHEEAALSGKNAEFVIRLEENHVGETDSFSCRFMPHVDPTTNEVLGYIIISQSMTQHDRVLKELETSERRFRNITNAIPQLLWTAKWDGQVDYANNRCLEYTGKTKESFAYGWVESLHPDDKERIIAAWVTSTKLQIAFKEEYRLRNTTGEYRWFLGHAIPICSQDNKVEYWIGTATDIEEERRQSAELRQAKMLAEDASQAKTSFLANISHELRTPLGVVLGYCKLLKENQLPKEKVPQYLDAIERNAKILTRIIDDLLDLTRIEAGRIVIDTVFFNPKDIATEALNCFSEVALEKKISLNLYFDSSVPSKVESDPVRLRQILINIVGNAVKFTDAGSVSLRAFADPVANGKARLSFEIQDTGKGLSEEQYRHVFDPFYQADASNTRRQGGAGLGLAISQRLADALGGEIKITKFAPNRGCTFLVSVVVGATTSDHTFDEAPAQDKTSNGVNVTNIQSMLKDVPLLVVDDSDDNLLLTKQVLQARGAVVDTAASGKEALRSLKDRAYAAILLDIQMPEMDGFDTIKNIRNAGFQLPVIAMTAHARSEDKRLTASAGFAYHLCKPLDFDEMIRVVSGLIQKA